MAVQLRDVVLSYPNLYEARAFSERQPGSRRIGENDRKYYSAVICIPKDYDATHDGALTKLMNYCGEILQSRLGDRLPDLVKNGKVRWPFKMTAKPEQNNKNDGSPMADPERFICWFNATSLEKPGTVDRAPDLTPGPNYGKPLVLPVRLPTKLFAGAIVNVNLTPAFSDYGTPQVSLFLNHIQHWDDGERIDGRVAPQDAFQADHTMEAVPMDVNDGAQGEPDSVVPANASARGRPIANLFS